MQKSKPIWESKTFWVNLIILVLSIFVLVDPELLSLVGLGEIGVEKVMGILLAVTAILNKILRFMTSSAVTLTSLPRPNAEK